MAVLTLVAPGRFLDGAVFGFMLMMLAGTALFMFGNMHNYICVSEAKKFGYVAVAFEKLFPMPGKKWAFNLTHDAVEENAVLARKKKEKADAKKAE
eukprot:g14577.t1